MLGDACSHEKIIQEQNEKQKELIVQLKNQLQDLESYAYESGGNSELPSNLVLEKQKVIIDELKEKINLPLDDLNLLSNEELKQVVDSAIGQVSRYFNFIIIKVILCDL